MSTFDDLCAAEKAFIERSDSLYENGGRSAKIEICYLEMLADPTMDEEDVAHFLGLLDVAILGENAGSIIGLQENLHPHWREELRDDILEENAAKFFGLMMEIKGLKQCPAK